MPCSLPLSGINLVCLPIHSMAEAHTCYTTDVAFPNSISPKLVNRIIQWLGFSFSLLRKAYILLHRLVTGVSSPFHPSKSVLTFSQLADTILSMSLQNEETPHHSLTTFFQIHKYLKNEMLHSTVPRQSQLRPPPKQHFISPFFQPPPELSLDEKYPLLIHTQPLTPGQVYIPHVDDDGNALLSPSTTRCSSSTLALCDDDTRKIFTPCRGPDRMLTPPPVCEKREQLMIRELLMMSSHAYSYAAPFYAVNQSPDRDNKNQKHGDFSRQPLRPPPPPLEVAPYRSSQRMWKKHFMDGLDAPDLPIMGYHARRLVHCNCTWDEDELMHLSRAFVWRASERGERSTNLLASFASEVHQVFHTTPWMGTDENFRRCLWVVVRETFVSCWHFKVCCLLRFLTWSDFFLPSRNRKHFDKQLHTSKNLRQGTWNT